ncbi:alpha/beta hydrolase [Sphingomonas sp. MMS12-HWE2-04]|uniref:alpha/beta hydrolase n=1 Tax=Sphingomonas sp. MMS12-HWE2-04 TaxID=3234199 RepID=UPI00384CCC26
MIRFPRLSFARRASPFSPRRFPFGSAACALLVAACTPAPAPETAIAPAAKLHLETFGTARPAQTRTLIVVLHGDGDAAARSDHYRFAAEAARAVPESAAVALLRPGYGDARGNRSPGERGTDTGDNFTSDRIAAVGDAIVALRHRYGEARVVIVGDAGGAAIAANLAGIRPGLIDGMVLVGCPCTLPEWRALMKAQAPAGGWGSQVASLDPLKTAGGVAPSLRVAVLVGADDKVTPAALSRAYAEALALRGVATDYRIVPGKGHDLLNDPEVLAATTRLAAALPKKI